MYRSISFEGLGSVVVHVQNACHTFPFKVHVFFFLGVRADFGAVALMVENDTV